MRTNKFSINLSILCFTKHIGWRHETLRFDGSGLVPSGLSTHNLVDLTLSFLPLPFTYKRLLERSGALLSGGFCLACAWVVPKPFLCENFIVMTQYFIKVLLSLSTSHESFLELCF